MANEPTIIHSFWERTRIRAERTALKAKRDGHYQDMTWAEYGQAVRHLALAFARVGVGRGDGVAILSYNRPEWAISDLATLTLGALPISIYHTSVPRDVAYILNHSAAKIIVAEDRIQVEKILRVRSDVPSLSKIVVIDPTGLESEDASLLTWERMQQWGQEASWREPDFVRHHLASIHPDDLAIVIYTSGTTGPPKGVMLTHDNLMFICATGAQLNGLNPEDRFFSFLPLAHALERLGSLYFPVYLGAEVGYAERLETVPENLAETAPTIVAAVPRFFEKLYQRVMATLAASPPFKRKLFDWAMAVGRQAIPFQIRRQPLPLMLRAQRGIADALVYRKLRQRLGGRLRFFISGGAPLSREIAEFFYALGLPIFEGYGATETTAPATVNTIDHYKFGTVGRPLPGVEIKIAGDGEILIRGRNVFRGYFKDERATSEALVDGWYHTGDIGHLDDDGFLKITDRKKELLITSAGKNISPQNIENLLKRDLLISQAVAIGDRRHYLTALLTLNPEALTELAHSFGLPSDRTEELALHPRIGERVSRIVESVNRELARFEQIKKFRILPGDFSEAGGELTPTLKLRRKFIAEKYAREIAALYEESERASSRR